MPTILRPNSDNDPANWQYSASDTPTFTGVAAGDYQIGHVEWSASEAVTADSTAPTLSSPTGAADGTTAADGTVSTTEATGTLYFAAIPTAGATPSAPQVKAGTGGDIIDASADSQAVSVAGVQNVSVSGLSASTAYKLVFAHEDAAITPNISTVAVSAEFTTDAEVSDLLGGAGLFSAQGAWDTSGRHSIGSGVLTCVAGPSGDAELDITGLLTPGTTVKIAYDQLANNGAGGSRFQLKGATNATTSSTSTIGHIEQNLVVPALQGGTTLTLVTIASNTSVAFTIDNLIITLVP